MGPTRRQLRILARSYSFCEAFAREPIYTVVFPKPYEEAAALWILSALVLMVSSAFLASLASLARQGAAAGDAGFHLLRQAAPKNAESVRLSGVFHKGVPFL